MSSTRRSFLATAALSAGTLLSRAAEPPAPAAEDKSAPKPKAKAKDKGKEKPKPDPYADAVLVPGDPAPIAAGAFTLAVLPDTQYYCKQYPDNFAAQTRWIMEQRTARNIAGVLHLGDITNSNTPEQWQVAVRALKQLDARLPLCMVAGNHDYGPGGRCTGRDTDFSTFLPPAFHRGRPSFGGFYDREPERVENSFHRIDAGGRKLLILCLEFGPRPDVVRWAREVVARHADRQVILVTHAFTYHNDTRYDWRKHGKKQANNPHEYEIAKAPGGVTDGEELWQSLVAPAGNFLFTINGHVTSDGLGRLATPDAKGRSVHQMLVNFQMRPRGGDGWLRLLEFRPDGTLFVSDYSPTRRERNESPQNQFTLTLA